VLSVALIAWLGSTPATASPCEVDSLRTEVRWRARPGGPGSRRDRVRLFAPDARPDCGVIFIATPAGSTLTELRATVQRADERPIRVGAERLVSAVGGYDLHVPEVRRGATLHLDITHALTEPHMRWRPAAFGPVAWAELRVFGGGDAVQPPPRERPTLRAQGRGRWVAPDTTDPSVALVVSAPGAAARAAPLALEPLPLRARHTALVLTVDAEAPRLADEPPAGATRVEHRAPASGRAAGATIPRGATDASCGGGTRSGWGCAFEADPAEGGERSWGWTEPTLRVVDEVALSPGGTLTVETRGGRWVAHRIGATGSLEAGFEAPADAPASVQLRLVEAGGRPVLPDRDAVVTQVAYSAIQASMPEPGLPLEFKNRSVSDATIDEIMGLVQRRVRTRTLPTRGDLSPRRLVALKPTGWGTPWEQSLLLTRYLRQLKLDALPVPVRPTPMGDGDGATPTGFTAAAVRLERDGVVSWSDPACPVCVRGELPPTSWGGQALAAGIDRLPPAPVAHIAITQTDDGVQVTLDPPAALALRLALLDAAPTDRPARVTALFGGLALSSQEGLGTPGAPVTLSLSAPAGPLPALPALLTWDLPQPVEATLDAPAPPLSPRVTGVTGFEATRPGLAWRVHRVDGPDGPRRAESLTLAAAVSAADRAALRAASPRPVADLLSPPPEPR